MLRCQFIVLAACCFFAGLRADDLVIDTMDELRFRNPKEKGVAELVEGKFGKAIRFSFAKDCQSVFFSGPIRGQRAWDTAAGFSFWVKGDGSDHFGGLELIYDEDYAVRYDYMFPIKNSDWTKITVAWRDLIPVLPGPKAKPLDARTGNPPSKITGWWFGKWWYWRDYAAHSYTIDDIRLEPEIAVDAHDYRPADRPLTRTLEKLRSGKPITVVTMGDSLTDFQHWANRQVSWPVLLKQRLEAKYHGQVTIVNPALGGTQLRQNLVLMPRWLAQTPALDLVTVCFGGNDWGAGMRGPEFVAACRDAVERIRRATQGKADVLILTTVPSEGHWTTMAELAEACRTAADAEKAGLADTDRAFHVAGQDNKERLFVDDKIHLSAVGHEVLAATVMEAIEQAKAATGQR